jgi:hypothetical protein
LARLLARRLVVKLPVEVGVAAVAIAAELCSRHARPTARVGIGVARVRRPLEGGAPPASIARGGCEKKRCGDMSINDELRVVLVDRGERRHVNKRRVESCSGRQR